jgi:hypothetical protein
MKRSEIVGLAAFSLALVVYVYAIGWLITAVRLSAAHLPVQYSLPMIDDKVLLATGLRNVLFMGLVFAGMSAVAYGIHAWTWEAHAQEWHAVVRLGRHRARALHPPRSPKPILAKPTPVRPAQAEPAEASPIQAKLAEAELAQAKSVRVEPTQAKPALAAIEPRPAPENLHEAPLGDPFVRVVAGFNVVVLAATLSLAVARIVKPLIDQVDQHQWWALLGPWAILTLLMGLALARANPLRGGRVVHALMWTFVVTISLLSMAPIGLLILTWAGIATLGRSLGRRQPKPNSKVEFALSPLPWVLLTIYALVGLAYYATPPVSFPQAIVHGGSTTQVGGYLAQTSHAVYLVSCTALADATSTDQAVLAIAIRNADVVSTNDTQFEIDSGERPSLPTVALHALGIDASTPTWIKPELRPRRPTCTGEQPPSPSTGFRAPWLGTGVIAGPSPPGARAQDGERPIEQTTPTAIAKLARRFQPTVLVTVADRFWPVSVGALLEDLGSGGRHTCLHRLANVCAVSPPKLTDLRAQRSTAQEFLEYPAPLSGNSTGQLNAFLRGQREPGTPIPSTHNWLADPGLLDPWSTAQVYFYYAGPAHPAHWPAPNQGIPPGLVALQYWFFYPYNYYPTVATPDLMNGAPLAGDVVNTDLHQGDWEHITVLVDPKTQTARWLYTARHSDEGHYYTWNSPLLSFDEGHPIVQGAFGGHPTYDAHCGVRPRFAHGLHGDVGDWLACGSGRFAFRAATTPLVDIAKTPWACWKGHFGVTTPSELSPAKNEGSVQLAIDQYYNVAGPRSPLWQAENGHLKEDYKLVHDTGVCANGANPEAPELGALQDGLFGTETHHGGLHR